MRKLSLQVAVLAAVFIFASVSSAEGFKKGDSVEVLWKGSWYPATVEKVSGEKSYITYTGYGKSWDEWVGPDRIRGGKKTDGTQAAGQGAEFKVGDEVRVLWKGSWYDAKV
nr:agenet domain-containing protein [bacterium]